MAASRSYFAGANHRFLPADHHRHSAAASSDAMIFELDEADVWNSAAKARSESPELRKATGRISRKAAEMKSGPASLPVNVPDWSKILKGEYRENRGTPGDDDEYEEEGGDRIPPHEFLARQSARARIACFSVHEGIGRTLKGRDLSRVRNAIWQKIGFED